MKGKTKGKDDFMQKKRILCKKMNKNSGILNIPEEFAGAVQKEMGSPNYFKFTREFKSAKI